jgi:uncharacterized protein (DUF433 family)
MQSWRDRISSDPGIHHGDPCIKGTRIPVAVIVGSIAEGDTLDGVVRQYPSLTVEDVRAALHFASDTMSRFGHVALS